MLSRVAENIYWLARYVERAENIARIVDVNRYLVLDAVVEQDLQWRPLVAIFGDEESFFKRYGEANEENVLEFLVCDNDNPNSISSCLRAAREDARAVRDQIPAEAFLQLNMLYLKVREATCAGASAATPELLEAVRLGAHLFFGLMNDTMLHEEGYRWAQVGRYIERADKTSRVLDVKYFILLPRVTDVGSPTDAIQWMAVLKSVSAYQMYWSKMAAIEPAEVVRFLLHDDAFPRSVFFCLNRGAAALKRIGQGIPGFETSTPIRHLEELAIRVASNPAETIVGKGLHQFIDGLQQGLNRMHGEIYEAFFSPKPASGS